MLASLWKELPVSSNGFAQWLGLGFSFEKTPTTRDFDCVLFLASNVFKSIKI